MRDYSLLYHYPVTSSDDTIYLSASSAGNGTTKTGDTNSLHYQAPVVRRQASKIGSDQPQYQQTDADTRMSQQVKAQHRRSASLLGRLRHPSSMSPTSSPTSECSSRDTHSERTLAHSASSGSLRHSTPFGRTEETYRHEPQRPSVRVLPPQNDADSRRGASGKKRARKPDGTRPMSGVGFISQLLRGPSLSSKSRSPRVKGAAGLAQFVKGSPPPPVQVTPAKSPSSFADLDSEIVVAERRFASRSPRHDGTVTSHSGQPGPNYTPAAYFGGNHHYHVGRQAEDEQMSSNETGAWYDANHMAALPVYEAIDMARAPPVGAPGVRATQPALPDARLLAPMASLAEVFPGISDGSAVPLSNRELRFAVENHMLVEQHRYLIRDLGHARSAIAALKQVVQAKEERLDSYEHANTELQQRVALLESLLTPDQRQRLAPTYRFNQPASEQLSHQSLSETEPEEEEDDDDEESRCPCPTRPLSGYVTGYSFSDKPVGHLPRVFSGDYSAAMETSVEALANAIVAMPRDEETVEDIIASKAAEEPAAVIGQARRRSRFFLALRLSTAFGSPAAVVETKPRRSVSLGNSQRPTAPAPPASTLSEQHLANSCPTLLIPGITGRMARRQASADSFGSSNGGRYPASLGLGSDSGSSHRVPSTNDGDEPHVAKRQSFAAQPRRSTSAPTSRPQSMRVPSRRRSWLQQVFGLTPAHDDEGARARRRVMTQSSTEVAQLLGALQLGAEPSGHLEDVADVSGEDEERAARPSVAEIRQQTLDALNGTARVVPDKPSEPRAGSRWSHRESSAPTIMRLNPPPPMGIARRGSLPSSSAQPEAEPMKSEGDSANGKRWAPAFWAPPPVLSPAHTWSPRDSADSFESVVSSDAPRGSLSSGRRRGGSPWEMVRASESRTFSPAHSRPGTPPPPSSARSLGFFDDESVPDADELAMAARRSLSLRMSRAAFRQAEPLPESDDALEPDRADERLSARNSPLAHVAESAAQPKRKSLLWQFGSKPSNDLHPFRSDCASVASDDSLPKLPLPLTMPKRPKKWWWTSVLGQV